MERPSRSGGERETDLLVAGRTLALDATAARVAKALGERGIRSLLLKGPSLAQWLYGDGPYRDYIDVDLLVSPADFVGAGKVLTELGFELFVREAALTYGREPHAETWVDAGNGLTVDLHRTIPGARAEPGVVWRSLTAEVEIIDVHAAELEIPREAERAVLLTLHAAHHGVKETKTLADLKRALARTAHSTWARAAGVAEALDATSSFAAGLRLLPEGRALAADLGLPTTSSVDTVLRAESAPELALSLDWLINADGWWPRARLIGRKLAPPVDLMRARSRLARRGPAGLVASYAVQPFRIVWQAPPAVTAWIAAWHRTKNDSADADTPAAGS